jgi:hypothetical protein
MQSVSLEMNSIQWLELINFDSYGVTNARRFWRDKRRPKLPKVMMENEPSLWMILVSPEVFALFRG